MRLLLELLKQIDTNLSKGMHSIKPREQKLIKVEALFIDEISGLAIIKVLDKNVHNTIHMKSNKTRYNKKQFRYSYI